MPFPKLQKRRRAARNRQYRFETLETRHVFSGQAVLVADTFSAHQNAQGQLSLDVLANDQFDNDYTAPRLITSVSYGSQGGRVEIANDRKSLLYAPPADYFGAETFVYSVDGINSAAVTINIQAPLSADRYTFPPDGIERQLDVLANDPFWDGYNGPRMITAVSVGSAGGSVRIAPDGRSIFYTVSREATTKESFIYVVDGLYPAQVTVDISPTVSSDTVELVQFDPPKVVDVLANDPFWASYTGARQITHVSQGEHGGTVQIAADGKTVTYTPPGPTNGLNVDSTYDSFHYVVDGLYEANVAVILYRPVQNDGFEIDAGSTSFAYNVTQNDYYYDRSNRWHDVVDRVTSVTQPENGTVQISVDGRGIIYTPAAGFVGEDSFTYVADDKHSATVRVTVSRPVRDDVFRTNIFQDTPNISLSVLNNDFRGNGYAGPRLITSVGATEHGGTVVISADGKHILYTPADGYVGPDRFTYTVDGTLTASVALFVDPLAENDILELGPEPLHAPYIIDVLANDGFRYGYTGPQVITNVELVSGDGQAAIQSGNRITFDPAAAGSHVIRYTVDGKYTATLSVFIKSHADSDQFVVDQNSAARTFNVLANDFDPDPSYVKFKAQDYVGPRLITGVTQSAHSGIVTIAADGKMVSYEPPSDFYGEDSFTYTIDGFMTGTVKVNVIRRVRDDEFRVDATDGAQKLPVLVNDLLGADYAGPGQITAVTSTTHGGTVVIGDHGHSITYTPAAGFVGTDTFGYTVDGVLKAEVRIVVNAAAAGSQQFGSMNDYTQFLIDDGLAKYAQLFGQPGWGWILETDIFAGDTAGRGHSETNVQVAGVDEADIVEFDSDYVYMLVDGELVIVDAWPAEGMSVASRFDVDGRAVAEFLHGDRLTIISEVGGYFSPFADFVGRGYDYLPSSTIVTVLDVSDRSAPTVVQKTEMDGRFVDARGVGDFVYVLVSNTDAAAPMPLLLDHDNDPETLNVYETADAYAARLRANAGAIAEAALPNYTTYGSDGELVRTGLLNTPEDIYRPLSPNASNLISVVSFNVESDVPGLTDTSAVFSTGASTVYASLDNFYVFDTAYDAEDGALTRITKFDWEASTGSVEFVASTTVAGTMINQFSADESGEFLRIATTASNWNSGNWTGRSENLLFVLREDDGVFEYVGGMQNLALGETMRSVRFLGDRAFVTTFANVDPLFAIDLSDPASPEAIGHITLPGFATYMHLVDANHLLTVGRNTPGGTNGPTQVSLFDISDMHAPRRIAEYTFERFSTSEAELDHHAFGFYAEFGLLAMPVSRSFLERVDLDGDGYRETSQWVTENELAVFTVDVTAATPAGRLVLSGRIEHDSTVRRSGFIGDKLYSIADDEVKVVDVTAVDTVIAELLVAAPAQGPVLPSIYLSDSFRYVGGYTVERIVSFVESTTPLGSLREAVEKARADLSGQLQQGEGAAMYVSAEATPEAPGGGYNLVFRVGEKHYLYRTNDVGNVQLIDSNFKFQATDVWHAVDIALPPHPPQLRGDYNVDGRVDLLDYQVWKAEYGSWSVTSHLAADGNHDGVVNSTDYTVWRGNLGAIWGDYNRDGEVNSADYVVWRNTLGSTSDLRADGDGDGRIGEGDFNIWKLQYSLAPAGSVGANEVVSSSTTLAAVEFASSLTPPQEASASFERPSRLSAADLAFANFEPASIRRAAAMREAITQELVLPSRYTPRREFRQLRRNMAELNRPMNDQAAEELFAAEGDDVQAAALVSSCWFDVL